jgi:SWI/SNF-related matrix-associated actin-dependent regulator of chromatin subfamily A member 5
VAAATTTTTKRGGKKKGRSRMTEAEEDAQMLKSAASKRRGIVRLDHQPSLLASHCKMRKYQLEGLNWMIHLHDHGIHGILADEVSLC